METVMNEEDAISREKALQTIRAWFDSPAKPHELKNEIERMPSVYPKPKTGRWIPVSERLPNHPENNDYYMVTIKCEHHDGWDDYVTGFAEWTKHGWDELSCYIGQIKVVAWMPLPEPYKAESEG